MDPKLLQQLMQQHMEQHGSLPLVIDPDAAPESKGGKVQAAIEGAAAPMASKAKQVLDAAGNSAVGTSLVAGYKAADAARDNFIANTSNQLDLQRNSVMPQGNPEFREGTRTVLDAALPTPADALLLGGGKLAGKIIEGAREFNKLGTLGSEIGAAGDITAAHELEKAKAAGNSVVNVPSAANKLADKNAADMANMTPEKWQQLMDLRKKTVKRIVY